jgi:hypothetical protein
MRRYSTTSSKIVHERHYGMKVWTNELMDRLRKDECLCLRCGRILDHGCPIASMLYKMCKENNLALAMTRCKNWISKKEETSNGKE